MVVVVVFFLCCVSQEYSDPLKGACACTHSERADVTASVTGHLGLCTKSVCRGVVTFSHASPPRTPEPGGGPASQHPSVTDARERSSSCEPKRLPTQPAQQQQQKQQQQRAGQQQGARQGAREVEQGPDTSHKTPHQSARRGRKGGRHGGGPSEPERSTPSPPPKQLAQTA